MSVSAVCPGSFDPLTNGHLDVIERAATCFDRVVVGVLVNAAKPGLFDVDERVEMIRTATAHLDRVVTEAFDGLLVDFCAAQGVDLICKGLRAVSDFEYELKMAQMNHQLGGVETVFMPTSPQWSYLSSSLVKEVARLGGRIDGTVPPHVAAAVRARLEPG